MIRNIAILLFVVLVALMLAANLSSLPFSVREIKAVSHGTVILDSRLYYTADEAYRTLDALGVEGRQRYQQMYVYIDILLPLIAAGFTWTSLTFLIPAGSRWRWLRYAGVASLVFDYSENLAIYAMLSAYPARLAIAGVAGLFTAAKFASYATGLVSVVTALARRKHASGTMGP